MSHWSPPEIVVSPAPHTHVEQRSSREISGESVPDPDGLALWSTAPARLRSEKGQRAVLKPAAGPGTTLCSQPPEPKPIGVCVVGRVMVSAGGKPTVLRESVGDRTSNSAAKKSGASPKKSPHARESPARRGNGYRASLAGEALKPVTPCQPPRRGCTDPFGPSTLRPCNAPCLTVGFRPAVGLPCRGPPDAAGGVPITVSESDTGTAKGYPGR